MRLQISVAFGVFTFVIICSSNVWIGCTCVALCQSTRPVGQAINSFPPFLPYLDKFGREQPPSRVAILCVRFLCAVASTQKEMCCNKLQKWKWTSANVRSLSPADRLSLRKKPSFLFNFLRYLSWILLFGRRYYWSQLVSMMDRFRVPVYYFSD